MSYVSPVLADPESGSTYFFINATFVCTKYDGSEFMQASEVIHSPSLPRAPPPYSVGHVSLSRLTCITFAFIMQACKKGT